MQTNSRFHQTPEQLLSENQWVEAAKLNPVRFEPLYKKYYEQIFRYVYNRMEDVEDALDVTAMVFVKAMTKLNLYEFRGVPFSSWLFRIAMSEVYQHLKDTSKNRLVNVDVAGMRDVVDELNEDENEENKQLIIQLIGKLPEKELQLIEMRYFEKRSYKEIGEILGISENNAKVRSFRILEKLKREFKVSTNPKI
jgi:RNA polymerase sigma-70 factor, ECF subfamily